MFIPCKYRTFAIKIFKCMHKIKFGTDGWRAIIAKEFTTVNVARISMGVALYLKQKEGKAGTIVIGHDCRFGGALFMQQAASVFASQGFHVLYAENFVSTPMISLATLEHKASMGVIITASHNPPSYNGYKLKGAYGGPVLPDELEAIEALIPDSIDDIALIDLQNHPLCKKEDFEQLYIDKIKANFDLDAIKNSGLLFGYDAMYGAGQGVMNTLFPEIERLHCTLNPGFEGIAPEPILKNLKAFQQHIRRHGNMACGLATDGDADRIGLFDSKGNFVDSHHIILLLIHYLVKYKEYNGKVITAFSVTDKIKKMCAHYGLEQETVKIGFKYIAGYFLHEDILLGGEESGGIAVKGHIPERDGIWMGLIIWEFMAKSGKSLEELIKEVYEITGSFAYDRADLHLSEEQKQRILEACKTDKIEHIAGMHIQRKETVDGFKYHFENGNWLMIRASGTEPVVRVYAEAANEVELKKFLDAAVNDVMAL